MRARITAVVTILVVVGIAVASVLAYAATASQLRRQTDQFLTRRADDLTSGARLPPEVLGGRPDPPGPPGNTARPTRPASEPDASVQLLDHEGVVVVGVGGTLPIEAVDRSVAAGQHGRVIRGVTVDGVDYRMITAPYPQGAVQVARNVTASHDVLTRLALQLALLGVALAIASALFGWFLMKRSLAPLERLTVASERVADSASGNKSSIRSAAGTGQTSTGNTSTGQTSTGDTSTDLELIDRVDAERGDEIGRLARSMDRMLASLAMSREQQRRLVQDAAHELRTPLTSLRANVEFLSYADQLDAPDRAAILAALQHETDELSLLFDELVQLAIDPAGGDVHPVETDVVALTSGVVDRFRRRTGRTVDVVMPAPNAVLTATVVVSLVERAITNLLGNAHKFAPVDTPITVEISSGPTPASVVWWHVRDEGPGIDAADRDRIFDRFYRSEEARARQGSGLGLAIVRQVAEQHGGSVSVSEAPGGGADVGFSVAVNVNANINANVNAASEPNAV